MDDLYSIPQDLLDFRDTIRQIAQEKIAPRAGEIDRKSEYPWDVRKLLGEQDILGLPFDEELRRHRDRHADAADRRSRRSPRPAPPRP